MSVRTEDDMAGWVSFFLDGIIETADKSVKSLNDILSLQKEYELIIKKMGKRASSAFQLLDTLYKNPFIDISSAKDVLGITYPTAKSVIEEFERNGILSEVTGAKRWKKFVMSKYLEIFLR